jgi:Trk K+ transport system NAD-binding subunit
LSLRAAAIERLPVLPGSKAVGKQISDLAWPPSVRLVTVFRGPFLIPPAEGFVFRVDDIVIAIGLRADLDQIAVWFAAARAGKA